MAGWGLPYQGSKSAHAGRIYRLIRRSHPDCRHLWEPFTGGGSVAHIFAHEGWQAVDPYSYLILRPGQAISDRACCCASADVSGGVVCTGCGSCDGGYGVWGCCGKTGIPAKLIAVGLTATRFSVADRTIRCA